MVVRHGLLPTGCPTHGGSRPTNSEVNQEVFGLVRTREDGATSDKGGVVLARITLGIAWQAHAHASVVLGWVLRAASRFRLSKSCAKL